jgi:uncharacterized lipoprotein YddW (UPF0748 family)
MLRVLMAGLFLVLAFPMNAQTSFPVAKVDPSADGPYPGNRGADELIVYTPAGGRTTTGTNNWGTEAVVRAGVVVAAGGNDTAIPADGFVVSGHGEAARWIARELVPGTPVVHAEGLLRVDDSPPARVRALLYRMRALEPRTRALDAMATGPERRRAALAAELAQVQAGESFDALEGLHARATALEGEVWTMELQRMPSPAGEVRAVWHRVRETTREGVAQLAADWAAAGVNVVFPETIYASQAIYPDPTGLYPMFEWLDGFDLLGALVEECHARGIEVHAWVHCFFIGIAGNEEEPPLLADRHPEWLAMNRRGEQASTIERGYLFFNPAQPELRARMIAAYEALAAAYPIDGFQFDYIRYGQAETWESGYDYSDATRARVVEQEGFDPLEVAPDTHPDEWARWLAWREGVVTSFVEEAAVALRARRADIVLSADVFPDLDNAIAVKGQNWAAWGRAGTIDALVPMAYVTDAASVQAAVRELDGVLPAGRPVVIGLGPYLGLSAEQLIEQVAAARAAGATGQALFDWRTTPPDARTALSRGPWRQPTRPRWR